MEVGILALKAYLTFPTPYSITLRLSIIDPASASLRNDVLPMQRPLVGGH